MKCKLKKYVLTAVCCMLAIMTLCTASGEKSEGNYGIASVSDLAPDDGISPASDLIEQSPFLDVAFTCLERDNVFLRRYNEITGAGVETYFELGVPYVWGGKNGKRAFSKLPDYNKFACFTSSDFFKEGKLYLDGFDCSGFTNWIRQQLRMMPHPSISKMIGNYWEYRDSRLFSKTHPGEEMPPIEELHNYLQPGDLLAARHGEYHVMMYMGTLAEYGFTKEEVPELAEYLNYPLVIHCGLSPVAGERFQTFLDNNRDKYKTALTTDGCVEVSILGIPPEKAAYHEHVQRTDYDYCMIDSGNCCLPIWDMDSASAYVWLRLPDKRY